jgi:hypothetical protein
MFFPRIKQLIVVLLKYRKILLGQSDLNLDLPTLNMCIAFEFKGRFPFYDIHF